MKELIFNQNRIPKAQWRYGFRSSAAVGCGWIATNNALVLMDRDVDVEKLIRDYERQLPIINGNAGTVVWGPALMLRRMGFQTGMSAVTKRFDTLCRNSDVCILFYYWRRGLKVGSHFTAVKWTEQGFVGYNTFRHSSGPDLYGPSLEDFIRRQGYFGAVLTYIHS